MFRIFLCLAVFGIMVGCNTQIPTMSNQEVVASVPNACLRLQNPINNYTLIVGHDYTGWSWILSPACANVTYQLIITNPSGVVVITKTVTNQTYTSAGSTLPVGMGYKWYVTIVSGCSSCTGNSETRIFNVQSPDPIGQLPVQLLTPINGGYVNNPVKFSWKAPCSKQKFNLSVDGIPYPGNPIIGGSISLNIPYQWHSFSVIPIKPTSGCSGIKVPNTVSETRSFYVWTPSSPSSMLDISSWSWLSK